ncbi:MAG: acyl-CoA dehydrogenase family protein [Anaerolineae bacterium]|nr:acyl-CoA dehydrogenase family protein [Anaerolineae bacterium]
MAFQLTEDQKMLQELAHEFSANEIVPVAAQYDRENAFAWPVFKKAQEVGLINLNIPEAYGGPGLSTLDEGIVNEELAWGCSGIATALGVNALASWPIILGGSEEQKREWLGRLIDGQFASYCVTEPAAGSDVVHIRTQARKVGDHYVLNGSKTFISNATVANFFVVFAKTDPDAGHRGMSAFIVERTQPGVSTSSHFDKLGQRASDTAEVFFEDVELLPSRRLGRDGDGFGIAMGVFDRSRPTVAISAVGVARRALELALQYSKERETFGHPILSYQAIGHMLANAAMDIHAGRLLAWHAAWLVDNGMRNTSEAAYAKAFAADMCMRVTTDAVQVFGGYGYMKEYPVEKLMRDAKVFQIYEGTSQIQRNIIVRELARH